MSAGVPVVGAPDIERSLGTAHAALAFVMFVVPALVGLVVEPALFLLADRYPRRWFIRAGVGIMAIGTAVCALAPGPTQFAIGMSVTAFATGTATGLAQATLVDREPDDRGRTLARWTRWSLAGDIAAPALLAVLAIAGVGWRGGFAIVSAVLAVACVSLSRAPLEQAAPPASPGDDADARDAEADTPRSGLLASLREALRDRLLIAWLLGCALCDLLDEIFVVFASIHVRATLGASMVWQTAIVGAFMGGAALGLAAVDRILKVRTERWLLVAASLATLVALAAFVVAPTPAAAFACAIPVGFASAPLYPLAAAQAYATRPAQSGSVLAAGHLFTPLSLALPWLVGFLADEAGTAASLVVLLAQPVGLVVLVGLSRSASNVTRG